MSPGTGQRESGFSLLEVLVAFSIMAMALGALYNAAGGGVRGVAAADQRIRAALAAQSLLAVYDAVPPSGIQESGTTGDGFAWTYSTHPDPDASDPTLPWRLHQVEVAVSWEDRGATRAIRLLTLLPERPESTP